MASNELGPDIRRELCQVGVDTQPEIVDFRRLGRVGISDMLTVLGGITEERARKFQFISRKRVRHDALKLLNEGKLGDTCSQFTCGVLPAVTANLIARFDADDDTTIDAVSDGNPVGSWSNIQGSEILTQAIALNKPIYKLAIQNGRNVVRFDGMNDNLEVNTATFEINDYSLFFTAFKPIAEADGVPIAIQASVPNPDRSGIYIVLSADIFSLRTAINGSSVHIFDTDDVVDTDWHVWSIIKSETTETIYKDGIEIGQSTTAPEIINYTTTGRTSVGSVQNVTQSRFLDGDLGEWLFYSDAKGSGDQTLIETCLKEKWGTP